MLAGQLLIFVQCCYDNQVKPIDFFIEYAMDSEDSSSTLVLEYFVISRILQTWSWSFESYWISKQIFEFIFWKTKDVKRVQTLGKLPFIWLPSLGSAFVACGTSEVIIWNFWCFSFRGLHKPRAFRTSYDPMSPANAKLFHSFCFLQTVLTSWAMFLLELKFLMSMTTLQSFLEMMM